MKRYYRHKLSLFLAVMLVLPTLLSLVPAQTVSAADPSDILTFCAKQRKKDTLTITVEAGQQFYAGDQYYLCMVKGFAGEYYVPVCSGAAVLPASAFRLNCSSTKTSVASVEKTTGLVTAKKPGKASIKMTIGKKITVTLQLKVVKAGALNINAEQKKLNTLAATRLKGTDLDKIRVSMAAYRKLTEKYNKKAGEGKGLNYAGYEGESAAFYSKDQLMVPMAGRYAYYETQYDPSSPLAENSIAAICKPVKMTASAKNNTITVTLKKAVTTDMIRWMETLHTPFRKGSSGKIFYTQPVWGVQIGNDYPNLVIKLTAGSKKITLYPYRYVYKNGKESYRSYTMKKGSKVSFQKDPRGNAYGFDALKAVRVK